MSINSFFVKNFPYIKPSVNLTSGVKKNCTINKKWPLLEDYDFRYVNDINKIFSSWEGLSIKSFKFENNDDKYGSYSFHPKYFNNEYYLSNLNDQLNQLNAFYQVYKQATTNRKITDEKSTLLFYNKVMGLYDCVNSINKNKVCDYNQTSPQGCAVDFYLSVNEEFVAGIEIKPYDYFNEWDTVIKNCNYDLKNLKQYSESPLSKKSTKYYWCTRQILAYLADVSFAFLESGENRVIFWKYKNKIYYSGCINSDTVHPVVPYFYLSSLIVNTLTKVDKIKGISLQNDDDDKNPHDSNNQDNNNNNNNNNNDGQGNGSNNNNNNDSNDGNNNNDSNDGNDSNNNNDSNSNNVKSRTIWVMPMDFVGGRTGGRIYYDEDNDKKYFGKRMGMWEPELYERELKAYDMLKNLQNNITLPKTSIVKFDFGDVFFTEFLNEIPSKDIVKMSKDELELWKKKMLENGKKALQDFFIHGVVHNDISISNIIFTKTGVSFLDFDNCIFRNEKTEDKFKQSYEADVENLRIVIEEFVDNCMNDNDQRK